MNGIRVDRRRLAGGDLLRFATAEFRVHADPSNAVEGGPPVAEPAGKTDATDEAPEPPDLVVSPNRKQSPSPSCHCPKSRPRRHGSSSASPRSARSCCGRSTNSAAAATRPCVRTVAPSPARDRREADLRERDERLQARDEEIRRLRRDLDDAGQREQRLSAGQSEARREVIEREGVIAGLNYELQIRDGHLRQLDEQRARLQQICDDYAAALAELEATHAQTSADLVASESGRAAAQAYAIICSSGSMTRRATPR